MKITVVKWAVYLNSVTIVIFVAKASSNSSRTLDYNLSCQKGSSDALQQAGGVIVFYNSVYWKLLHVTWY